MTKPALIAAAALVCVSTYGCQQHSGSNMAPLVPADANSSPSDVRQEVGGAPNDHWITVKTKLALVGNKLTSGYKIDVSVSDGVASLTGAVDTRECSFAAGDLVRRIKGVKRVDNQIQIVPEARRNETVVADSQIEDEIRTMIKSNPSFRQSNLTAMSRDGAVMLSGSADNHEQLLAAVQAIRNCNGVKYVVTRQVDVRGD
jgi:hyperosmotically inducible protein